MNLKHKKKKKKNEENDTKSQNIRKKNRDEKILKVAEAGGGRKLCTERQSKNHRILTESNISKKTWSNIFKILEEEIVGLKFYIQ